MILKEQLTKRKGLPVINLSQPGNEIYQLPPENDSRSPMDPTQSVAVSFYCCFLSRYYQSETEIG